MELIKGYDTQSFISGFQNHCNRHKTPRVVTADAGSQIASGTRMMTRSQVQKTTSTSSEAITDDVETAGSIDVEKAFKEAARAFKDTRWVLAPTESQHFNGKMCIFCKECRITHFFFLLRSCLLHSFCNTTNAYFLYENKL